MNLFRPYRSLTLSAEALDDLRLNKMILESGQLLSTALRIKAPAFAEEHNLYKITHQHHPIARWCRASYDNYMEMLLAFECLYAERLYRTDKEHKTFRLYAQAFRSGAQFFPLEPRGTEQPNCTDFPDLPLHEAYRMHLIRKWQYDRAVGREPTWTHRECPEWAQPHLYKYETAEVSHAV